MPLSQPQIHRRLTYGLHPPSFHFRSVHLEKLDPDLCLKFVFFRTYLIQVVSIPRQTKQQGNLWMGSPIPHFQRVLGSELSYWTYTHPCFFRLFRWWWWCRWWWSSDIPFHRLTRHPKAQSTCGTCEQTCQGQSSIPPQRSLYQREQRTLTGSFWIGTVVGFSQIAASIYINFFDYNGHIRLKVPRMTCRVSLDAVFPIPSSTCIKPMVLPCHSNREGLRNRSYGCWHLLSCILAPDTSHCLRIEHKYRTSFPQPEERGKNLEKISIICVDVKGQDLLASTRPSD